MGGKIKKFLLSFSRLKKPVVFGSFLFCLILGLIIPLQPAYGFVQLIGMWVATLMIAMSLQFTLAISTLILGLAGVILSWVLSPYFITIPYTKLIDPTTKALTIVGVGWPLVRDLANLLFIIILVFIGLATALRLGEYQAKKTLPILIGVALLINFTPVICGLIVDATNIFMNFFLEGLTGMRLMVNQFSTQASMLWQFMTKFWNPFEMLALIAKTIILTVFNLVTAFILLMYAALFIIRYIAIWMLVILSPIAFLCYILPATRKVWTQWWNQFWQWCIIGVTGAFFLYLGEQIMVIFSTQSFTFTAPRGGWIGMGVVDFMGEIMQYMVVLAFMIVGFMMATSTGAMGGAAITGFFKKQGLAMATAAGRFAKTRAGAWARGKIPAGVGRWGQRLAMAPTPGWGVGKEGWRAAMARGAGGAVGMLRRGVGAGVAAGVARPARADYTEGKRAVAAATDVQGALAYLRSAVNPQQRAGAMAAILEKGWMKDARDESVVGKGNTLQDDEIMASYKQAREFRDKDTFEGLEREMGTIKDPEKRKFFLDKFAEIADKEMPEDKRSDIKGVSKDDKEKGIRSYQEKIFAGADTADKMKQFGKGWYDDKENMEAFNRMATGEQLGIAARTFKKDYTDKFEEFYKDKEKGLDWYLDPKKGGNKRVPIWINTSPAARTAGLSSFTYKEGETDSQGRVHHAGEIIEGEEIERRAAEAERRAAAPPEVAPPPPVSEAAIGVWREDATERPELLVELLRRGKFLENEHQRAILAALEEAVEKKLLEKLLSEEERNAIKQGKFTELIEERAKNTWRIDPATGQETPSEKLAELIRMGKVTENLDQKAIVSILRERMEEKLLKALEEEIKAIEENKQDVLREIVAKNKAKSVYEDISSQNLVYALLKKDFTVEEGAIMDVPGQKAVLEILRERKEEHLLTPVERSYIEEGKLIPRKEVVIPPPSKETLEKIAEVPKVVKEIPLQRALEEARRIRERMEPTFLIEKRIEEARKLEIRETRARVRTMRAELKEMEKEFGRLEKLKLRTRPEEEELRKLERKITDIRERIEEEKRKLPAKALKKRRT